MKYLLKNGTVISGAGTRKQDVLVEGEKIIKVGKELSQPDAKVVDVSGKLLFPGFIDGHTHFDLEVAGTVTADDFETGTRAAILGGTTLVIDFASQDKGGHTLKEGLEKWHKKADGKCSCDYSFHMSIVEWNEETKKEIQDMISALVQTYEKVKGSDVLMAKEVQTVGVCPVCGSSVTERQKGFFCSKRECHFALWKNSRYFESIGKSLTSAVAQKLLSNGEVKLKGCKSAKTGRMYDAIVVMTVTEEGKPQFNMNFENGGKSK